MSTGELTPYQRLMAEAIPTGTFGGARPPRTTPPPIPAPAQPWTPEEQARHVSDALDEVDAFEWHDEYADAKRERDHRYYQQRRTHLQLIHSEPANDDTAAA